MTTFLLARPAALSFSPSFHLPPSILPPPHHSIALPLLQPPCTPTPSTPNHCRHRRHFSIGGKKVHFNFLRVCVGACMFVCEGMCVRRGTVWCLGSAPALV